MHSISDDFLNQIYQFSYKRCSTGTEAEDLSDEFCVPIPYIEEKLKIQCHGENGSYGLLKKTDNGKYISNILVVDYKEFDESNNIYERHLPDIRNFSKFTFSENDGWGAFINKSEYL